MNRNDFFSIEVSIFPDVSELQAMHKVISIQKKIVTTFSRGRWRPVKCNICKYILPATRNYLMEQHITRRHEGKPLTWTVPKRDSFRNPGAYQPEFFEYRPRRIDSRRSLRKSPRRLHVHQKATDSHLFPVGKTSGGPSTPISETPLSQLEVLWRSIYMDLTLLPLKGGCWLGALYLPFPSHPVGLRP